MSRISKRAAKYEADRSHQIEFTALMDLGSQEFGGLWLQANRAAVDRAVGMGMDTTEPAIRHLMASVIFRTLQHSRYYYTSEWEKAGAAPPAPPKGEMK